MDSKFNDVYNRLFAKLVLFLAYSFFAFNVGLFYQLLDSGNVRGALKQPSSRQSTTIFHLRI